MGVSDLATTLATKHPQSAGIVCPAICIVPRVFGGFLVMLTIKMIYSALLLSSFTATVALGTALIIADAILLAYGIARLINKLVWKN